MKAFFKSKAFAWGVIIAILGIIVLVARKIMLGTPPASFLGNKSPGTKSSKWKDDSFPLKLYSSGNRVLTLQQIINRFYNAGITEDGYFGNETRDAFQKYFGDTEISEADYNTLLKKYNVPNNVGLQQKLIAPDSIQLGEIVYANADTTVYRGTWTGKMFEFSNTKGTLSKNNYAGTYIGSYTNYLVVSGIGVNAGQQWAISKADSYIMR